MHVHDKLERLLIASHLSLVYYLWVRSGAFLIVDNIKVHFLLANISLGRKTCQEQTLWLIGPVSLSQIHGKKRCAELIINNVSLYLYCISIENGIKLKTISRM
jgi:hypothetical protein